MTSLERRAWIVILLSVVVGSVGQRLFPLVHPQPETSRPLRIDLNRATFEDLLLLPGVGPKRAQAILAHRPYHSVDDLLRVPGIGRQTLERLRAYVVVDTAHHTP